MQQYGNFFGLTRSEEGIRSRNQKLNFIRSPFLWNYQSRFSPGFLRNERVALTFQGQVIVCGPPCDNQRLLSRQCSRTVEVSHAGKRHIFLLGTSFLSVEDLKIIYTSDAPGIFISANRAQNELDSPNFVVHAILYR